MIQQTITDAFLLSLLLAQQDFDQFDSAYSYNLALYTSTASLGRGTAAYTTENEVVGGGYIAGGQEISPIQPQLNNGVAHVSFTDVVWTPASFTARAGLVYNSFTGVSVAVLDFGAEKTATGQFTVQFPPNTATSAVIRIN